MSQFDFGTINPDLKSGTQLASDMNSWRDALHSMHRGSSRPSYAVAGMHWIDDTATPWTLKVFDGISTDTIIATYNSTTNVFTPVLVDLQVTTAKLAANAVTPAKMSRTGTAGQVLTSGGAGADPSYQDVAAHGQCRLVKSGANLLLSPYNGNKIIINGTAQTIPSAGVSLAPPATTNTTYYIYAYMNSSTMTLEASTTGHATDSTTGVEIKSGDATRTLVGMARTVSSAWVDTYTQRFVASWFNKQIRSLFGSSAAQQTAIGAAWVALTGTLVELVCCGITTYYATAQGSFYNTNASASAYCGLGINGASIASNGFINCGNSWNAHIATSYSSQFTEGYHTLQSYAGGDGNLNTVGAGYAATTATVEG